MKILHLSPSYFHSQSVIGGGERYAYELARAQSRDAEVTFLSFSEKPGSEREGRLKIEYLKKGNFGSCLSGRFFGLLAAADVIHCHQVFTPLTDFALWVGKTLGKKVYVTDLGGGARFALSYHLPLLKQADAFLLISEYSKKLWENKKGKYRPGDLKIIYGGVDTEKFFPGPEPKSKRVLFAGRLLPHKGVDVLIDAVSGAIGLDIAGRVYDEKYYALLQEKSKNKDVRFYTSLEDKELVLKYRQALVTVLPSVYKTVNGEQTQVPELFGLTVLESMACGTPAIVTNVASLPEIVRDRTDGFIVAPNDPRALREKIEYLLTHPEEADSMGRAGLQKVLDRFTWAKTAGRCLEFYKK